MKLIYDEKTKLIVASQTSNQQLDISKAFNMLKIFPDYPGNLSICDLDIPISSSLVGAEISFQGGIPYKVSKNGKIFFEISKEELEKKMSEGFEANCKRSLLNFPCNCLKGSIPSFLDRLIRSPNTDFEISSSLKSGSYFDRKISKVGWWGSFTDAGGYANMNRQIISRLHNYRIIPYIRMYPTILQVEPVVADMLNQYCDLSPKKGDHPFVYAYTPMQHEWHNGKRIFFTMFETATLHPTFVDHCNKYCDEIWVPSKANKQVFVDNGIKKSIRVVPLGIDELIYFSDNKNSKKFDGFLSLFGMLPEKGLKTFKFVTVIQWNFRKGFDALLQSFINAFSDNDDVCLVITTQYSKDIVWNDLNQFLLRRENLPQIVLYNKIIPTIDMPSYYKQFDCYIHLSRGEGFSLTQIEAAACGLPVISCFHSGMTEYLNDQNSFIIPCTELERCGGRLSAICYYYQNQLMWKIGPKQVSMATDHMRHVVGHYQEAKDKASVLYKDVIEKYTWRKTTERVSEILSSI